MSPFNQNSTLQSPLNKSINLKNIENDNKSKENLKKQINLKN